MLRRARSILQRIHAAPQGQAGFSLVETLAALGILALAGVPLVQLTADATRNAAALESRMLARTVAENVLAEALSEVEPIEAGVRTGKAEQMARTYDWTLTASAAEPGSLQSLTITVSPNGRDQTLARLQTLKAIPRPLPLREEDQPSGEGNE
ncbi:MAG: type II secretion system minor pseudopilin GspI [Pseudomonadota bacterium]